MDLYYKKLLLPAAENTENIFYRRAIKKIRTYKRTKKETLTV